MNYNGTLIVEGKRPGGETVIGDVLQMVEEAQTRQAPVQRLADKVMIISAVKHVFWNEAEVSD